MQNHLFMFAALALLASGVHAENETVEFSVSTENTTTMATVLMGNLTPFQHKRHVISTECNSKRDLEGTPIESTYSVETGTGMTTMVLPLERTATGIKAYVSVTMQSADSVNSAVINKDCKLPIGTTSSSGISLIDSFDWGKPHRLKLSDGSVVVVTANQTRRVGIDYQKLSKAVENGEVNLPAQNASATGYEAKILRPVAKSAE